MRVLLYSLCFLTVLLLGIVGIRGHHVFDEEPLELWGDMAKQDRINPQAQDNFFNNGSGARILPAGSAPKCFTQQQGPPGAQEFTRIGGNYLSSGIDESGFYGTGFPPQLSLKSQEEALAFVKNGAYLYKKHCSSCHGLSANGKGVIATYPGFPVLTDLADPMYAPEKYPNGKLFYLITYGQGNMIGYGNTLPIRERWSIITHLRVLQKARPASSTSPATH